MNGKASDEALSGPPANKQEDATPYQQSASVPAQPLPQDVTRPYPQYQSQMQNAGMAVGATASAIGGSSIGDGVVLGAVGGGFVGQRIAQAQNHAFYRDQAMQYREGRAAGTIPSPEELYHGKKASWWSKEGRAQRRAERWERRAKRRDDIN